MEYIIAYLIVFIVVLHFLERSDRNVSSKKDQKLNKKTIGLTGIQFASLMVAIIICSNTPSDGFFDFISPLICIGFSALTFLAFLILLLFHAPSRTFFGLATAASNILFSLNLCGYFA